MGIGKSVYLRLQVHHKLHATMQEIANGKQLPIMFDELLLMLGELQINLFEASARVGIHRRIVA